mmetsp:Transcript_7038/g.8071  ORF Transcript_7038/g.8071 Transcript_7038/m.8071 type:complete len:206 (-) Transcript_7038:758-1375(-)|eukprot:CAMPEP_0197850760 /NCGR_PEP_ID=MMETSP1438-20131217/16290_1 /TAXON_ID=1461541 /ORGANISM="Pterosperma sp., Strain CCMP1384" /LENGTH=205 /DNA_ID=CAMNT_0043464095 /DNA_START=171 /DNA_END=788 /DNA_ORIENTATION=-
MGCGSSNAAGGAGNAAALANPQEAQVKLHSMIRWEKKDEVKEIITASPAVVNIKDEANGNTAVHIAAQNGHLELLTMLVKAGADVNAQNGGGQTALHMCITYELNDCIAFLKKSGANLEIKNNDNIPAKYGLGGERDPDSSTYKMSMFKEATTEDGLVKAIGDLKQCTDLDKAQVAQVGLQKKRENKAAWTANVQKVFGELVAGI